MMRAGLVDDEGKPLVSYHGLRHTCASLLLMRGVKLIEVSRRLGHQSMTLTDAVYGHYVPNEGQSAAVEAFRAIAPAPPQTLGGASGDVTGTSEMA